MRPFGRAFDYREEIYQYRSWQLGKVRVLTSLDLARTNTNCPYLVPISWCKQVGEGKLFYNNIGHREDTLQDEKFLKSIVGAVRWIVGKEQGSAIPNPEVSKQQHQLAIDEPAKVGITPESPAKAEQARKPAAATKQAEKASQDEAKRKQQEALTWIDPARAAAEDQDFIYQGRFETQVFDSFGMEGLMKETGGIYSVAAPTLNMCLPPLTWQTYDFDFTREKFDAEGKLTHPAKITVMLNGVVVHKE